MAFLTPAHATSVIYELEAGELRDGLECSVLPLLDAIQKFFDRIDDDYFPLPITGLFSWYPRRFELAVRPPHDSQYQRLIEADAYLDAKFISPVDLEGALGRQVSVVIAPLRPDVQEAVAARPALDQIVIPADKEARALSPIKLSASWMTTSIQCEASAKICSRSHTTSRVNFPCATRTRLNFFTLREPACVIFSGRLSAAMARDSGAALGGAVKRQRAST